MFQMSTSRWNSNLEKTINNMDVQAYGLRQRYPGPDVREMVEFLHRENQNEFIKTHVKGVYRPGPNATITLAVKAVYKDMRVPDVLRPYKWLQPVVAWTLEDADLFFSAQSVGASPPLCGSDCIAVLNQEPLTATWSKSPFLTIPANKLQAGVTYDVTARVAFPRWPESQPPPPPVVLPIPLAVTLRRGLNL